MKIYQYELKDSTIIASIKTGSQDFDYSVDRAGFEQWLQSDKELTNGYSIDHYYAANAEINDSAILAHLKEYIQGNKGESLSYEAYRSLDELLEAMEVNMPRKEFIAAKGLLTTHITAIENNVNYIMA